MAQLNTLIEPKRQSPRTSQARGRRRSHSPRESRRPTYRFGEATLESEQTCARTEGGSRQWAARLSGPMTERGGHPRGTAEARCKRGDLRDRDDSEAARAVRRLPASPCRHL